MSLHVGRMTEIATLLLRHASAFTSGGDADEFAPPGEADPGDVEGAERLARDLEEMGPAFVKFGQLLSTRRDLLPAAYTDALARLQDDVAPIPTAEIRTRIEGELGAKINGLFSSFNDEPLAAASLAQVHRAVTRSGRDVVVKVQRPGAREQVREDMETLDTLATLAEERTDAGRRVGISRMLAQFRRAMSDELDYRKELTNLQRFRELVADAELLFVPEAYPDYCTPSVLTMEYVPGKKVSAITPIELLDIEGPDLARELFDTMLKIMLIDGLLHADPHPGNLLVTPDGRICLVDLGQVAAIPQRVRSHLVKLLVSIGEGDGEETATLLASMGRPLEDYDPAAFRDDVSHLVSSTVALGSEIQAGAVIMDLARLAGEHGLRPPAEMSMVGKALLNLDETVKRLDPTFAPADAIRNNMPAILTAGLKPSAGNAFTGAIEMKEFVERLPKRANRIMDSLADGEFSMKVDAVNEERILQVAQQVASRLTAGLVLAAITVAAALLMHVDGGPKIGGYPALAIIFFLLAAIGGLLLVATSLWQDRSVRKAARLREDRERQVRRAAAPAD